MSTERLYRIVHIELDVSKFFVRCLLNVDQISHRTRSSHCNLKPFNINPLDFLRYFVTVNDSWLCYYIPESKREYQQWRYRGSPLSKRVFFSCCLYISFTEFILMVERISFLNPPLEKVNYGFHLFYTPLALISQTFLH